MPTVNAAIATALAGTAAVLTLAACGGSSSATDAGSNANQPPGPAQGAFPGANGLIASVSGSTLQVQGQQAQTAVTYSGNTAITATKSVALSAVKAGDCVSANGSAENGVLTATNIRISQSVNGDCATTGPAGGLPGRPEGAGAPPSGLPGGGTPPSGAPGAGAGFTVATGKVTDVAATGLTLSGQLLTIGSGASPSPSQGQVTVSAGTDTTVSKEVQATSAALVVGKCARAIGDANDKGTIAATSINVSEAVDGKCAMGFRGAPA